MNPADDVPLAALAATALANVGTEYPFHLMHLARSEAEIVAPRALHPVFHGAYDWHSCVHMHWTLARCLRLCPDGAFAAPAVAHFSARFTAEAMAGECAYFAAPDRSAFERPYGWAWLLLLASELDALSRQQPVAAAWRDALAPLAERLAHRFVAWLPKAQFPVRSGTHGNTAFALVLARQYASGRDPALAAGIEDRARRWYGADQDYPSAYEPGGDDFLSGGLCEALLMSRVLPADAWGRWWSAFAPTDATLEPWRHPVPVADATDPKIVHLHGLNLSRAWCWRQLLPRLPATARAAATRAAAVHLQASLAAATGGAYVGTHWLASFALLAATGDAVDPG